MCVCVYDDEEENEEYESECDESYSYMHCANGPLYHMCMCMLYTPFTVCVHVCECD